MPDVHAHVGSQPIVKISKAAADYAEHADGDEQCKACTYFERVEPNHCARVKGIILPNGWCKLWEAKKE